VHNSNDNDTLYSYFKIQIPVRRKIGGITWRCHS